MSSLYQQTMSLMEILHSIPGFDFYLFPDGIDMFVAEPTRIVNPVDILAPCFRLGAPLCMIVNLFPIDNPIDIPQWTTIPDIVNDPQAKKSCKHLAYTFLLTCMKDLGIKNEELFTLTDLDKDDTNLFMKVLNVINRLVDRLKAQGRLPPLKPLPFNVPVNNEAPKDNRAKVLFECLETERKYIEHLERLQTFSKEVVAQNILSKDLAHQIFANLDDLLDFQRRFLLAMESTLAFGDQHRLGALFIANETSFCDTYEPFCSNFQTASDIALEETQILARLSHIIPVHEVQSYLIKPIQRICKYPLLLKELIKYSTAEEYPNLPELLDGLESVKRVTEYVNEQKRIQENVLLKNDLIDRVDDWKGLQVNDFGDLLLTDRFSLASNEGDAQFSLFLFEKILLCCKELPKKRQTKAHGGDDSMLAVIGNIYITTIQAIQDVSRSETLFFGLKVFWRDVKEMESFVLKARNPEQVRLWKERIEQLMEMDRAPRFRGSDAGGYRNSGSERRRNTDDYDLDRYSVGSSRNRSRSRERGELADNQHTYNPYLEPSLQHPQPRGPSNMQRSKSNPHNYYPPVHPQQQSGSEFAVGGGRRSMRSSGGSDRYSAASGEPAEPPPVPPMPPVNYHNGRRPSAYEVSYNPGPPRNPSNPANGGPSPHVGYVSKSTTPTPMTAVYTTRVSAANSRSNSFSGFEMMNGYGHGTDDIREPPRGRQGQGSMRDAPREPPREPPRDLSSLDPLSGGPPDAQQHPPYQARTTPQPYPQGLDFPTPPGSTPVSPGRHRKSGSRGVAITTRVQTPEGYLDAGADTLEGQGQAKALDMREVIQMRQEYPRRLQQSQAQLQQLQSIIQSETEMYDSQNSPTAVTPADHDAEADSSEMYHDGNVVFKRTSGTTGESGPIDQLSSRLQPMQLNDSGARWNAGPGEDRIRAPPTTALPAVPGSVPGQPAIAPRGASHIAADGRFKTPPPGPYGAVADQPRRMASPANMNQNGAAPGSGFAPTAPPSHAHYRSQPTPSLSAPGVPNAGSSLGSSGASSVTMSHVKIKIQFGADIFVIAAPLKSTYSDLYQKIERKMKLGGTPVPEGGRLKLKYKDEDGDLITVNNDDDVSMAFDVARRGKAGEKGTVNMVAQI